MSGDSSEYIASLDVGTTTLRCQIINKQACCIGSAYSNVRLHYPELNSVEIDPDELWNDVVTVVKQALSDANVTASNVKSLGISTQRGTFLLWRKDDGKPLHNFITWKDVRASELIEKINRSWKVWALRMGSYLAHLVTRMKKFHIVSRLKFSSSHVTVRLLWVLQNNDEVRKALSRNNLVFGTLDTWLVYKLTGGKTYVTDVSNASATGLYDPFGFCWSFIPKLLNIPVDILPPVVANDYQFGETLGHIFGAPVQIGAVMADQSSSMYGSCSFEEDDVKITLGTGAFLDVNTGESIQDSLNGMYPLVGWKTRNEFAYFSEVPCSDAGSLIEWMLTIGLVTSPDELSKIATKLPDNGGVYFVPAFSGLGPPINNETATSGFKGIKPNTQKGHMVRAVLESIVYRTTLACEILKEERKREYDCIRLDGGVSKNDFVCQLLADMTNLTVERLPSEMSSLGVAYVAGIACGFWVSKDEIAGLSKTHTIFKPTQDEEKRKDIFLHLENWEKAARRFMCWYD